MEKLNPKWRDFMGTDIPWSKKSVIDKFKRD